MSLLEYSRCAHCGKPTWQEFVPMIQAQQSYWRCRDCGDRRQAERIRLDCAAVRCQGRIQTSRLCAAVLVVDVSPEGAHLRFDAGQDFAVFPGENVLFNPQLQPFGELARYHPAVVRWNSDTAFGVRFEKTLRVGPHAMQRILKR